MLHGARLRLLAVLILIVCASALAAQSFDFARDRQPIIPLDSLWRFHPGDSPSTGDAFLWATPAFNDSSWPTLRSDRPWSDQGYPNLGGFAWYRFQVHIPAGQGPTSILLAPILTSFRVFVDGRPEGGLGKMPSVIPSAFIHYEEYPLTLAPASVPRTVQVAIRVWHSPIWAGYVPGGMNRPGNLAGDPALLATEKLHHQIIRNSYYVDAYSWSITAALVGLAILGLFLIRPAEREYLWFAVMLLAMAADNVLYVAQQIYSWPALPINDLLDGALMAINIAAAFYFFARVLEVKAGWLGRMLLVLLAVSPFAVVLYWPQWASPAASAALQLLCQLPAVAWILAVLIQRSIRGNLDARLLLIPTLLDLGYYLADNLAILLGQAGIISNPRILELPLPLPPFTIQNGILLHLVFLLALLVFLIRRFALARQREQRLQGEFEAARQVQLVLLPDELDQCPGFRVESFYRPADEVGGDFFQQIADPHCGMLVVIGDVSGKGLSAAMIVSVLVGAIRAEAAHGVTSAALLNSLNDRMIGRTHGGFVTCLAAWLSIDGLLTVANAGHIPPYLNGQEIDIQPSLPLGILDKSEYTQSTIQLAPGDRLTFLSDGVVEAQSRSGELFGFDRTRALSTRSAKELAQAAQAHGQQDDITVVTVEFCGQPCPVPVEALHA